MKRFFVSIGVLLSLLCAHASAADRGTVFKGKKVAVISVYVNKVFDLKTVVEKMKNPFKAIDIGNKLHHDELFAKTMQGIADTIAGHYLKALADTIDFTFLPENEVIGGDAYKALASDKKMLKDEKYCYHAPGYVPVLKDDPKKVAEVMAAVPNADVAMTLSLEFRFFQLEVNGSSAKARVKVDMQSHFFQPDGKKAKEIVYVAQDGDAENLLEFEMGKPFDVAAFAPNLSSAAASTFKYLRSTTRFYLAPRN